MYYYTDKEELEALRKQNNELLIKVEKLEKENEELKQKVSKKGANKNEEK